MIVQDGYVDAMYDQGSDLKAKEDKGTMNYFTVVREGDYQFVPIEWSYEVGNKNLSITISGDATDDPVPDSILIILFCCFIYFIYINRSFHCIRNLI